MKASKSNNVFERVNVRGAEKATPGFATASRKPSKVVDPKITLDALEKAVRAGTFSDIEDDEEDKD